MFRTGRKYMPQEILPLIRAAKESVHGKENERIDLDGDPVKFGSARLKTYTKGIHCVRCGLKGLYFVKERHHVSDRSWHLNFYGLADDGTEVMMTSDHIVPRSRGGSNELSNRQPMCAPCNEAKGNTLEGPQEIAA